MRLTLREVYLVPRCFGSSCIVFGSYGIVVCVLNRVGWDHVENPLRRGRSDACGRHACLSRGNFAGADLS
jgi:hypothetical protein